jgi:Uma2 family endonuclease
MSELTYGTISAYDICVTTATLMTADELYDLPDDGWRYELVRGELRKMSPAGAEHGSIAARIIISLGQYVDAHALGVVYATDTGFFIERSPDTVRGPDAAFVRADRVVRTAKFFDGPPDVAFEVISPGDTYSEVEEKTLDWLAAGVRVVVIVDPRRKCATIRRTGDVRTVTSVITVDDLLPGWKLPLSALFA